MQCDSFVADHYTRTLIAQIKTAQNLINRTTQTSVHQKTHGTDFYDDANGIYAGHVLDQLAVSLILNSIAHRK